MPSERLGGTCHERQQCSSRWIFFCDSISKLEIRKKMMPGFLGTSESFSKKIVPTNPIPKGTFQPPQAQPDNVRDFVRDFCLRMAVSRAPRGFTGGKRQRLHASHGFSMDELEQKNNKKHGS